MDEAKAKVTAFVTSPTRIGIGPGQESQKSAAFRDPVRARTPAC